MRMTSWRPPERYLRGKAMSQVIRVVNHDDDDPETILVDTTLQSLVEHYQQNVHTITTTTTTFHGDDNENGNNLIPLPNFSTQSSSSRMIPPPPMIQLWLDRWAKQVHDKRMEDNNQEGKIRLSLQQDQGDHRRRRCCCDGRNNIITRHALYGYIRWIRPTLLSVASTALNPVAITEVKVTGIPVLQSYELLLSQWLKQDEPDSQCNKEEDEGGNDDDDDDVVADGDDNDNNNIMNNKYFSFNKHENVKGEDEKEKEDIDDFLIDVLKVLAMDIDLLTSVATTETSNNNKRPRLISKHALSNIVLPTLMRLMQFNLIELKQSTATTIKKTRNMKDNDDDDNPKLLQAVHCRFLVTALAFGRPQLEMHHVWPRISQCLDVTKMILCGGDETFCSYPLVVRSTSSTSSSSLSLEQCEFPKPKTNWWCNTSGKGLLHCQLDGTTWDDPVTGVSTRQSILSIWKVIFQSMLVKNNRITRDRNPTTTATGAAVAGGAGSGPMIDLHACCSLAGMEQFAQAVRAHFFGRDMYRVVVVDNTTTSTTDLTQQQTRWHLGQRVSASFVLRVDDYDAKFEKPCHWIPSRIHVVMQFIALLHPDDVGAVLEQILPILYELISATNMTHVAFGATGLIQLLDLIQDSSRSTTHDKKSILLPYVDTILPVLTMSIMTCREGAPLTLLCQAQSMIFATCLEGGDENDHEPYANHDKKRHERLGALQELLIIVDRNNHRRTDDDDLLLLWGVLMAGVIPLLRQLCDDAGMAAVEVGRLGLHALLPIIQQHLEVPYSNDDTNDSNNQSQSLVAATVIALINLMMAAYPIMPHHGGKIMYTLFTACAEHDACSKRRWLEISSTLLTKSSSSSWMIMSELFRHTAAVALVLCGQRAAEILDEVQHDNKQLYDDDTVKLANDIEHRALELTQHETENEQPIKNDNHTHPKK